jgi:hypothetical protein
MSFRSRIEHFEVQKTLQGGQLPLKKNIFGRLIWGHVAPLYDVTMQLRGLNSVESQKVEEA